MAFLLSSVFVTEVLKDSPVHWWRLGEPQGATTAFDRVVGGQDFTYFDSPHPGNLALVTSDSNTSVRFDHTLPDRIEYSGGNIITSFPFTLEAVIQTNGPNDNFYRVIYTEDYVHDAQQAFTFRVGDSFAPGGAGCVGGGFSDMTLGNQVGATSSVRVDDGLAHHVAVVFTNNTTVKVYVDGVDRTVIQATNASYTIPTVRYRAAIGNIPLEIPNTGQFGLDGSMQDCVLYNTSLSATRIAAHAAAVSAPWNGDTPGQRVGRILDAAGFPAVDRVISAGASVMQTAADLTGTRALDAMQTVADSEFGKLFVNVNGAMVFKGRGDSINQTIKATFTDQHGSNPAIIVAAPEYTDQLIRNDVAIQRSGGLRQVATDATSIAAYQDHGYEKTGLQHNSDDTSRAMALYIVSNYKDPLQRVSQLVIKPRESVTLFATVMSLELTDWISVSYTPQGVGSAFTQTTVVEGIQHDFSPKEWTTTFSLSPADTKTYWQLGVTGFGELGVNTRLFW